MDQRTRVGFLEDHALAEDGVLVEKSDDVVEGGLVNHRQHFALEGVRILRTVLEDPKRRRKDQFPSFL